MCGTRSLSWTEVRERGGEMRGCCQSGSLRLLFCGCCERPESLWRFIEIGFLAVVLWEQVGPPQATSSGLQSLAYQKAGCRSVYFCPGWSRMDPGGRRSTVSSWNGSSPPSLQCLPGGGCALVPGAGGQCPGSENQWSKPESLHSSFLGFLIMS